MHRTWPARFALLGSFLLASVGCASDSCGEHRGWFSRFRNHASPAAACPCEGIPCSGPEIPGLPPPGVPSGGMLLPGPGAGVSPGPMPGAVTQPGEAQPIPYSPQSGRGVAPARTTGKP